MISARRSSSNCFDALWRPATGRAGTSKADEEFITYCLAPIPLEWRPEVTTEYHLQHTANGEAVANTRLREISERLRGLPVCLPLSATDDDIREKADRCAKQAFKRLSALGGALVDGYRALSELAASNFIEPPPVTDGTEEEVKGAVARMVCRKWWRRQISRLHQRTKEACAIDIFGIVHAKKQKYVSNASVKRWERQKRSNAAYLEAMEAVNQHGYTATLAALSEKSASNPTIGRSEIMVRCRGKEEIAREMGHAAIFITVTGPSAMHAKRVVYRKGQPMSVRDNPEYDGTTPREAQKHLRKNWAKTRAGYHRQGIRVYGERIAEPHHDGTPHWHFLLFMPPDAVKIVRELFTRYFLTQHSPDEPGAQKNRVKFVTIKMDEAHSATGYILKYIAKNIDGHKVQKDLFGDDAIEGAARVKAWASTWGIRQFQQIGGAPVGVWRELRRMEAAPEHTPTVEAARQAADAGEWADYLRCQGGPTVARKDLAVTLAKTRPGERWCPVAKAPEPAPANRYGETRPAGVYGVLDTRRGRAFESRRFKWEIRRVGVSLSARPARAAAPWTRVNNCTPQPSGACAGMPNTAPEAFASTWPEPKTGFHQPPVPALSDVPDHWPDFAPQAMPPDEWFSPLDSHHLKDFRHV
jgi:hypothetical protein